MTIFFQLIIASIFFIKIKSSFKELINDSELMLSGGSYFYLNLTNLGKQVEFVNVKLMAEAPKGYKLVVKSLSLLFLESNEILFDDTKFKEIESSYYHHTTGIFINYKYWFNFKIELKNNTKYLLFKIPSLADQEGNIRSLDYTIQLNEYKIKVESNNNNNNKSDDNNTIIYITFTILLLFTITFVVIIICKKKKSEMNYLLNIHESKISINNIDVNTPYFPGTPNYDIPKPDYSVENNNNGITKNYDSQNLNYEKQNLNYDEQNLNYDKQNLDFEAPLPVMQNSEKPYHTSY